MSGANASSSLPLVLQLGSARITIISYDLLSKVSEQAEGQKFKVVLLDEAHYIKNLQARLDSNLFAGVDWLKLREK